MAKCEMHFYFFFEKPEKRIILQKLTAGVSFVGAVLTVVSAVTQLGLVDALRAGVSSCGTTELVLRTSDVRASLLVC